jgi:hypothetical protein
MPWIDEEDDLLKTKLQGFVVTDARAPGGRGVKVWYRHPEMELREQDYPFMVIDLIGVGEALDRAQRGGQMRPTVTGYRPPEYTGTTEGRIHVTEWPVAMDLSYQVTTYARNIQHDRQMMRAFWTQFPGRYGSLGGKASPYVRPFSAQMMGMVPGDRLDEFGKRQFRKMFTLKVFSELWASPIHDVHQLENIDLLFPVDTGVGDWFSWLNCHEVPAG